MTVGKEICNVILRVPIHDQLSGEQETINKLKLRCHVVGKDRRRQVFGNDKI